MGNLLSIVVLFAVFYFVLIMPEQKKQKRMKAMLESLKVGANIVTRGGIIGEIINIDGDQLVVATGPNRVKLSLARHAVATVIDPENKKIEENSRKEDKTVEKAEEKVEKSE